MRVVASNKKELQPDLEERDMSYVYKNEKSDNQREKAKEMGEDRNNKEVVTVLG